MKQKVPGLFFTLEGIDGSGKSTQMDLIGAALQERGYDVLKTRAPGGTPSGKVMRDIILSPEWHNLSHRTELFLFLADRAQHVDELIRPALEEGKIVLCDRYNDSTIAYQSVARGMDMPLLKMMLHFATGDVIPDLTLLFDLSTYAAVDRRKHQSNDRIEQGSGEFFDHVRTAYLSIAKEEPDRFRVINADRTKEEIAQEGLQAIEDYFRDRT